MAYDEALVARVRAVLSRTERDVVAKKMFGGVCFMVRGHMCCGVTDVLMLRVGKDAHAAALARPHARPMTFTGRPMDGFVFVDPPGWKTDKALAAWLARGTAHVATLPLRVATRPSRTVAGKKPAAQKPALQKPALQKPAAQKPAANKPSRARRGRVSS